MTFESFPDDVVEFSTQENVEITPEQLLEKPEAAFVQKGLTVEQQRSAVMSHESIIANPELFLGSGNNAVVFELPLNEGTAICLKHIWETVSVEMRGKGYHRLPKRLQELRKIQDYFANINEKRRKIQSKANVDFALSNTPMAEAGLQVVAQTILEEAGFEKGVPKVKSFMRVESKGEDSVDGFPYAFNEVADVIAMEKVNGKSVQDFILSPNIHTEVLENLDVEAFKERLKKMVSILHENNLTHQDITNRNIMIDFDTLMPVIIDFGKASYRGGSFSKEEELRHVDAVCKILASFKKDPDKTRTELKRLLDIAF